MAVPQVLMSRQIQQLLGRQLAALYDRLPLPPASPELSALLVRLATQEQETAVKLSR